jgi:ketosteroid isomerase-like protein
MKRADQITPRTANERIVLNFFTALMRGDLKGLESLWTTDAIQEHMFLFDGLTPALIGRDEIVGDYQRVLKNRSDLVFHIEEVHQTLDPDCLIVEAFGKSVMGETGHVYDQRYLMVFQLSGNRIAMNRIYFDPLITQAAFAGVLIGRDISPQNSTWTSELRESIPGPMGAPANHNEQVCRAWYALLVKQEWNAWSALWHDDAVQENPFAPQELVSEWVGKQSIVEHYKKALENRRDHSFAIDRLHRTENPDCIIVEARGSSTVGETNRIYNQRYVMVFRFKDGKIILNREYFNPIIFLNAFDGFLVTKGKPAIAEVKRGRV